MKVKPYPKYTDSGLSWLGKIPTHWDIRRLKRVVLNVNEQTNTKAADDIYLALEHVESWTGRIRLPNDRVQFTSQVKRFRPNDVLFGKLRPYLAKVARPTRGGVCVSEFLVLRVLEGTVTADFLEYTLRSLPFIHLVSGSTSGAKMPRVEWLSIGNVVIACPPRDEQERLVHFARLIDRGVACFIRAKRQLVKLLNEQKQVIVHQAVTRGLDLNVPLKPSGVDWLGNVPEHWHRTPVKHVAKVQTGLTLGKNYGSMPLETRPYLRVANVQDGYLDLEDVATVSVPPSEAVGCQLQPGDVLMTEGGDIDKLGRGSIWRGEIPGCLHQNHIFAVRPNRAKLLPEYLALLMTSNHGRTYFQVTAKKTTNLASTNSTTLKAFPLFLPDIEEQQRLLAHIANETSSLDGVIWRCVNEINLTREYRARLIADVVTGKVDVRSVQLPPLDEAGAQEDWDEDAAEGMEEPTEAAEEVAAGADD